MSARKMLVIAAVINAACGLVSAYCLLAPWSQSMTSWFFAANAIPITVSAVVFAIQARLAFAPSPAPDRKVCRCDYRLGAKGEILECFAYEDPRCGSGWCTEHCRERCKGECLPPEARAEISQLMGLRTQQRMLREGP